MGSLCYLHICRTLPMLQDILALESLRYLHICIKNTNSGLWHVYATYTFAVTIPSLGHPDYGKFTLPAHYIANAIRYPGSGKLTLPTHMQKYIIPTIDILNMES